MRERGDRSGPAFRSIISAQMEAIARVVRLDLNLPHAHAWGIPNPELLSFLRLRLKDPRAYARGISRDSNQHQAGSTIGAMLILVVPLVAAPSLPVLKPPTYSGISRISRLSFLLGVCVLAGYWARHCQR